jgi:hypothetical protein
MRFLQSVDALAVNIEWDLHLHAEQLSDVEEILHKEMQVFPEES